jgi:hypothetical protein
MTQSNKYLSLPSDWLATFSLAVINPTTSAQSFLLDKDVNYIREAFPVPSDTGTPTHYAQFTDSSLILGPTPDASYQVELHYYYYPETIVTAGSTWLGNNFETVLLYGSLREAVSIKSLLRCLNSLVTVKIVVMPTVVGKLGYRCNNGIYW